MDECDRSDRQVALTQATRCELVVFFADRSHNRWCYLPVGWRKPIRGAYEIYALINLGPAGAIITFDTPADIGRLVEKARSTL